MGGVAVEARARVGHAVVVVAEAGERVLLVRDHLLGARVRLPHDLAQQVVATALEERVAELVEARPRALRGRVVPVEVVEVQLREGLEQGWGGE